MATITTILPVEYKGYTIQEDVECLFSGSLVFFPTEQGIQHDYDCEGESRRYSGNCKLADSVEEAKAFIDEFVDNELLKALDEISHWYYDYSQSKNQLCACIHHLQGIAYKAVQKATGHKVKDPIKH